MKNTLNPVWPPFELKANILGDKNKRIKVSCYDWDIDGSMQNGTNDLIGEFYTSLPELLSGKKLRWELVNQKKAKKKNYKNSGVIECSVEVCSYLYVSTSRVSGRNVACYLSDLSFQN